VRNAVASATVKYEPEGVETTEARCTEAVAEEVAFDAAGSGRCR
jgi:hypothetical protein